MAIVQFDTLEYFEKLKTAGAPEELAKIQANAMRDFSQSMEERSRQQLATKGDLQDARNDLQQQIQAVRSELKEEIQSVRGEIQAVRSELKEEIQAVRSELKEEIQSVRGEIQAVRSELKEEIQAVRSELKEEIQSVQTSLQNQMQEMYRDLQKQIQAGLAEAKQLQYNMFKWMLAIVGVLCGIMAKGFGWLGF